MLFEEKTETHLDLLSMLFLKLFSVLVAIPKKTTLYGGQSRSLSAEQGEGNDEYSTGDFIEVVVIHSPTATFIRTFDSKKELPVMQHFN